MALIQHGSFDVFLEAVSVADVASVRAGRSHPDRPRGLALKSLKLTRESKSPKLTQKLKNILEKLFDPRNEVYFLAWSWDFSGEPAFVYPGPTATAQTCIIPLKVGQVREFLGDGIILFPPRQVKLGIAIRIMIWKSDQGVRKFGEIMSEVANTVKDSELNNLLLSLATDVKTATVNLINGAAIKLAGAIGEILRRKGDDCVDFYEGYYSASKPWKPGDEVHRGIASEIVLTRLV
jgi:hypothetical protein